MNKLNQEFLPLNSYFVKMFYSWFGALFSAFVHGFVGLPVINISWYPPLSWFAGHSFWCGSVGCIVSSRAMHLPPDVCICCGSWILTVEVWLGLGRSLLADVRPSAFFPKRLFLVLLMTVIPDSYTSDTLNSDRFWNSCFFTQ